jgi:hypothetical protein
MIRCYKYVFFFLLLFLSYNVRSQNIQGTWEGEMNGELLRVSVEQKGMAICGFTHDYVLNDSSDNCTAAYEGIYNEEQEMWMLRGTYFIKNSGSHVLMRILLWPDARFGRNKLRGRVATGSSLSSLFGVGAYEVLLTKVSSRPVKLPGGLPDCFPKPRPIPKPKPVPAKPAPAKPAPAKPVPAPVKPAPAKPVPVPVKPTPSKPVIKDTVQKPAPTPAKPVIAKPDEDLMRKMTERKQSKQSTLQVNVKQINLKVYDNGDIDNDTVSIFYNGRLLLSHQRLSDKPIIINLDLDENITEHKLVMYAENLGGIPPNTALIVVTAGDKRYELRSKANLEENAVLIFEYKPK